MSLEGEKARDLTSRIALCSKLILSSYKVTLFFTRLFSLICHSSHYSLSKRAENLNVTYHINSLILWLDSQYLYFS